MYPSYSLNIYLSIYLSRFREICNFPKTIFFKATQMNYETFLLQHNNESFLFAALNIRFAFGAARLVVFRLVSVGDEMA